MGGGLAGHRHTTWPSEPKSALQSRHAQSCLWAREKMPRCSCASARRRACRSATRASRASHSAARRPACGAGGVKQLKGGLAYEVLKPGSGPMAQAGKTVQAPPPTVGRTEMRVG